MLYITANSLKFLVPEEMSKSPAGPNNQEIREDTVSWEIWKYWLSSILLLELESFYSPMLKSLLKSTMEDLHQL